MGGTSSERAISLSTGRQIVAALDPQKYDVLALDAAALSGGGAAALPAAAPTLGSSQDAAGMELAPLDVGRVAVPEGGLRPDVAFIALHGKGGEDGTIQGMLELLGIPYTGSGVLASALAMDKAMTKRLLRAEGIPVPGELIVRGLRAWDPVAAAARIQESFGFPVIVKPNAQGSTIGCTIVRGARELDAAVREALRHDTVALVEQYLEGVEITAGLLGNDEPQVLPLIEIVPRGGFYDYEAKYAPGGSAHIIPARIPEEAAAVAREHARACHVLLGCRGMSRVDMILSEGTPCVLEVNTIPGMTPTSLLPEAARAAGISFPRLLDLLIGFALEAHVGQAQ